MEHDDLRDLERIELDSLEEIAQEEEDFESYLARVTHSKTKETSQCETAANVEANTASGQASTTPEHASVEQSSSAPSVNGRKELVQDCNFQIPKPDPTYIQNGLKTEQIGHNYTPEPVITGEQVPSGYEPPTGSTIKDGLVHDDVYQTVFNETILSIAELPMETDDDQVRTLGIIEDRIKQLDDFIKKAKIQQVALRAGKEDRLSHSTAKARARVREAEEKRAPRAKKLPSGEDLLRSKGKSEQKKTAGKSPAMKAADTMAGLGMKGEELKTWLKGRNLLDEASSKYVDDKYPA